MPLYEYECQSCGQRTEALQRYLDPPLAVCLECGGPLKKLISAAGFHFKGSGWYATDYASTKSRAARSEGEKSDAAKPAESSTAGDKAETKETKAKDSAAPATPSKTTASS